VERVAELVSYWYQLVGYSILELLPDNYNPHHDFLIQSSFLTLQVYYDRKEKERSSQSDIRTNVRL
jgi:hypothetical protein